MNIAHFLGNITRDIELRYSASGTAIGKTAIATTRKFTSNGEKKEEVMFMDIVFFGRSAEVANQYLSKGSKIQVTGRITFSKYQDHNRVERTKHEMVVESMEMIGKYESKPANETANAMPTNNGVENTQQSYPQQQQDDEEAKSLF